MKSFRYKDIFSLPPFFAAQAMAAPKAGLRSIASSRGAALVIAMLVTLVLSGLGLIALHSVNDTTWKTANYRTRQQASQVSDAVAHLAVSRMGESGHTYLDNMDSIHAHEKKQAVEGHANQEEIELAMKRRGPLMILARNPQGVYERSMNYLFTGKESDDADSKVGGIFDDALQSSDGPSSFSVDSDTSTLNVDYRLIIRDGLSGPPATGFDSNYCFKKVTIASDSHVAPNLEHQKSERSWKTNTNNASNRNVIETMVGPVPCGER